MFKTGQRVTVTEQTLKLILKSVTSPNHPALVCLKEALKEAGVTGLVLKNCWKNECKGPYWVNLEETAYWAYPAKGFLPHAYNRPLGYKGGGA